MKTSKSKITEESLATLLQQIKEEIKKEVSFEELKKSESWEIGIDEAGRGPVIGPMVYGCCLWPIKYKALLSSSGFDDSKKLTEPQRELLFKFINELKGIALDFEYTVLSAEFLSLNQLKPIPSNLNEISKNAAKDLIINAISRGFNITHCYVDTVGSKATYQKFLNEQIENNKVEVLVSEKADSLFPIVSAASICAKVPRDHQIMEISKKYQGEMGSGYPSDPKTVKWLDNNFIPFFGYLSDIRFSWSTITTIMKQKDFDVDYIVTPIKSSHIENGKQYNVKTTQKLTWINYSL